MAKVILYSLMLVLGMVFSQSFNLEEYRDTIHLVTMVCLSYIMIEVGLEFVIDKRHLKSYGFDYLVAMTAAVFPWILCSLYFIFVLDTPVKESLLIGRFAAPTSAGILFAMLAAGGLGMTWLFKKAEVLAIFDDLDTILLMIPLQMMIVGFQPEVGAVLIVIGMFLFLAYRFMHQLKIPTGSGAILLYALLIVLFVILFEKGLGTSLEVILPAFCFGTLLFNPHDPNKPKSYIHEHSYIVPMGRFNLCIDCTVKYLFMFLVGLSMPHLDLHNLPVWVLGVHVLILTILSNLGKMFPSLCYRNEASLRERIALSVAMFPRGEVGAGVLLLAIHYDLDRWTITVGGLSLMLNLLLTGVFILVIFRLIKPIYHFK